MYWEEPRVEEAKAPSSSMVDVAFAITCKVLPVDHAHALRRALEAALPWLGAEERAGIHAIHGAESGNGWIRPDSEAGALLQLSRRTRMVLRVPTERVDEVRALEGQTLDIAGYPLQVGAVSVRALQPSATLFARYVVSEQDENEQAFLDRVAGSLRRMGVPPRKLLCGKSHVIVTPEGPLQTRSLMVADLDAADSVRLQEQGIGPGRKLGCGLMVPYKGIKPVRAEGEDK